MLRVLSFRPCMPSFCSVDGNRQKRPRLLPCHFYHSPQRYTWTNAKMGNLTQISTNVFMMQNFTKKRTFPSVSKCVKGMVNKHVMSRKCCRAAYAMESVNESEK